MTSLRRQSTTFEVDPYIGGGMKMTSTRVKYGDLRNSIFLVRMVCFWSRKCERARPFLYIKLKVGNYEIGIGLPLSNSHIEELDKSLKLSSLDA